LGEKQETVPQADETQEEEEIDAVLENELRVIDFGGSESM
jgi:hypothetical protein